MDKSNKYKLLRKVLSGHYTRREAESVFEYIRQDETGQAESDFKEISDEIWQNASSIKDTEENKLIDYQKEASRLLKQPGKNKHTVTLLWQFTSVAASIVVICSVGYWFFVRDSSWLNEQASLVLKSIPDSEEVQLTLSGENTITVDGKEPTVHYNDSGTVVINPEKTKKTVPGIEAVGLNSIAVPVGKRSLLTLSDGTKMWVNSGSKVVYPAVFEKSKREIYVDGEVYLEVVPDKERPFSVNTKDLNVKVLGTSFNVSAYSTDKEQSVVLVQGSVQVKAEKTAISRLVPNDLFSYVDGRQSVRTVDVNNYISWKDGFYQFSSERIEVIATRLSRYYGKTILCEEDTKAYTCSGKLDLQDDIVDVLNSLSKTAPIKYEYVNDEYILKNKD